MNWHSRVKRFLNTQIDLSANVRYDQPLNEAIRLATTKYFCAQCAKQIDYATNTHYESYCKLCYRQLYPGQPKKKLYRPRQSSTKAKPEQST